MNKVAIITGLSGQTGSYLAELLLSKGYIVHGIVRYTSSNTPRERLTHLSNTVIYHYGDVTDHNFLYRVLKMIECEDIEFYNLAAQSHVKVSFENPVYTSQVDGIAVLNMLEVIKSFKSEKNIKFYQAGTSEMFGSSPAPQNECTPFSPRSPYAVSKLYAYWITRNYRESYGIWACTGILFNHESPRRGDNFVTKKITNYVRNGTFKSPLVLGNLDAKRDWGHARDYAKAIWMMLQLKNPTDLVIGTGKSTSVRDFIGMVFKKIGKNVVWEGDCGYLDDGTPVITVDEKYFRPAEVEHLEADATMAKNILGWEPETNLDTLISEMLEKTL